MTQQLFKPHVEHAINMLYCKECRNVSQDMPSKFVMAGSVQYIIVDVMSLPSDIATMPSDDEMVICWKGWKNLDHMFDPRLLITRAYQICKERGQAFCEDVFSAWTSAVQKLSHDEVNAFEPFGKTVLNRCLSLLQALDNADAIVREEDPETFRNSTVDDFYDKRFSFDRFHNGDGVDICLDAFLLTTFASMTIELVRLKLTRETVEASFSRPSEAAKANLWKMVRGKKCNTRGDNTCTGVFYDHSHLELGVDLLMALIDKGLPRWCWAGHLGPFNDNLLQHVLEPAHPPANVQEGRSRGRALHVPCRKIQPGRVVPCK